MWSIGGQLRIQSFTAQNERCRMTSEKLFEELERSKYNSSKIETAASPVVSASSPSQMLPKLKRPWAGWAWSFAGGPSQSLNCNERSAGSGGGSQEAVEWICASCECASRCKSILRNRLERR